MDFIFHTLVPGITTLKVWKTGSSKVGGPTIMYASLLLSLSPTTMINMLKYLSFSAIHSIQ